METDRKHCAVRNHRQLDQCAVNSDVKLGNGDKLSRTEFTSSPDDVSEKSAMKFNNPDSQFYRHSNVKNSSQFFENLSLDDGYTRICELLDNLTSNISPPVPFNCTMERSSSWEFCSFSGKRVNLQSFSGSTTSSLCSYTEFEKIIRSFEDRPDQSPTVDRSSARKFFTYPRNNDARITRSHSDTGVYTDKVRSPITQFSSHIPAIDDDASYCNSDVNLIGASFNDESEDEYVVCKKRKIDNCAVCLVDDSCTNSTEPDWNWRYVRDDEPDDTENRSEPDIRLPRQHSSKLWYDDGDRTPRRMRSRSVTLDRPKPANSSRQLERAYSIGVMASAIDSRKCCARCEPDDCVRPRSWMRASMRLVRPFHLADPPETAREVHINLPPVFPCDIERPCSAPMPERPRQYGRSGQRRLSSRVSSVSSESQASSFGIESYDNGAGESVDSVPSESERSNQVPLHTTDESVSNNATQAGARSNTANTGLLEWSNPRGLFLP